MSRIYDQLNLPEIGSEPGKLTHSPINQKVLSEQRHPVAAELGEQGHQLQIDELAIQARLHVAAIERAHKRTADEVRLAEEYSVRIKEEVRLECLARERAEAEQAERGALVARIEAERQLAAQLEVRIEQEKIERVQAAQRAAQEEQLRRVVAEREEQERLLQAEENAAQMRLHEAAIEEARKNAAEELWLAERLAVQLKEEERLGALARERAQADEDERSALISRIEAERQLTAQIEVRIEQEKIERSQANKRAAHEEQLRIAAAAREAQERQLRIEESATQAESHEAAIEEARKRAAEEIRRSEELAMRLAEEARLEMLTRERTQIEQAERAALAARIEAERQLVAQIEARIEQERLELEQATLRDANEEKLRLTVFEREAMERRLEVEELAVKSRNHELPMESANKRGADQIRDAEKYATKLVDEPRLQTKERKQLVNSSISSAAIRNDLPASVNPDISVTFKTQGHSASFLGLDRRYVGFLVAVLLVIGVMFFMAGGSRKVENKLGPVTVQAGGEAAPVSAKVSPPVPEILAVVSPVSQPNVAAISVPENHASSVLQKNLAGTMPQEEKRVTASTVSEPGSAVAQVERSAKVKQRGEVEIRRAVMQWADAWSRRDATAYLSFYAADFSPPEGMQRAAWEEQRKSRLSKYQAIKLTLKNIKISYAGGNVATVSFVQNFKADNHMEIRTNKELDLTNTHGRWLIVTEKNS